MSDSTEVVVEVALLGSRDRAFQFDALDWGERGAAGDFLIPWEDRDRVSVKATRADTLRSVLDTAAERLGVKPPTGGGRISDHLAFIAFDPDERIPVRISMHLTLVGDDGRARWGIWNWRQVTLGELERAYAAKALDGSPFRSFIVPLHAMGNGLAIDWAALLKATWQTIEVLATVGGASSFLKLVTSGARERLKRGQQVIEEHASQWTERRGEPELVRRMLGDRPWHPGDLGALLGCSEEEAASLLWGFGYAERDGLWWKDADQEACLVSTLNDEIDLSYSLDYQQYEDVTAGRTRSYLETGKRPPIPGSPDIALPVHEVNTPPDPEPPAHAPSANPKLQCACGKPGCDVVAEVGVANGGFKLGFSDHTDHFVTDALALADLARQFSEVIGEARNPVER